MGLKPYFILRLLKPLKRSVRITGCDEIGNTLPEKDICLKFLGAAIPHHFSFDIAIFFLFVFPKRCVLCLPFEGETMVKK